MFLTAHAFTAAVIVNKLDIQSSWLAFSVGFFSHFVLDMIPHGDEGLDGGNAGNSFLRAVLKWAVGDLVLLAAIALALYVRSPGFFSAPVLAAMFGSMLPDGLQVVHHALVPIPPYMRFHNGFHGHLGWRIGIRRGLLLQSVFVVLALTLLLR